MKQKKILLVFIIVCMVIIPVFSKGNKEEGYDQVSGIKNWNHSFDITERKPGKYNIIIRGRDQAGNVTYEGPFNIFIDPESDLPVVSITNPVSWMRVGSTLNVVGTCRDDDEVAYVEIRVDDEDFRRVEGTEFWSYYLEVKDISDGEHVITARGVDNKGIQGKELSVPFHLDKNKPFINISNYASGDLVSGNISIEGRITDKNGIEAFSFSTDDGQTYRRIPVRYNNNEDIYTFMLRENTKDLDDGPRIYWFKAADKTGSVGYLAFLLFIDNTPPSVTVITPQEQEGVNGLVTFSGEVQDDIGVTEFFYALRGNEPQKIDIVPGNPYWNTEIDLSSVPHRKAHITFIARDFAGNVKHARTYFEIDKEADLPVITLLSPKNEVRYKRDVTITGSLKDDDGGKAVRYALNRGEEKEVLTRETFSIPLEHTVPGENRLTIYGIDENDIQGNPINISFFHVFSKPEITFHLVRSSERVEDFFPGFVISPDGEATIEGTIQCENKLKSAEWEVSDRFSDSIRFSKQATEHPFSIDLPREIDYGVVPITVTATDIFDQETVHNTFVYIENLASIRELEGIYFPEMVPSTSDVTVITPEQPLLGFFHGGTIESARLEPETEVITIRNEGPRLFIDSARDGKESSIVVHVETIRGHQFKSNPFSILSDTEEPEISIESPQTGQWVENRIEVKGEIIEANGLQTFEYSFDGGATFKSIPVTAIDSEQGVDLHTFESTISLPDEDGTYTIIFKAVDEAGRSTVEVVTLKKDTTPPEISIITPQKEERIEGTIVVTGTAQDANGLESVLWSRDGGEYEPVVGERSFYFPLGMGEIGSAISRVYIKAVDTSGNERILSYELSTGPVEGAEETEEVRPELSILSPSEDIPWINDTIYVVGKVNGFREKPVVTFSKGGDEPRELSYIDDSRYWVHQISLHEEGSTRVSLRYTATLEPQTEEEKKQEDSTLFSFSFDEDFDRPRVTLSSPFSKGQVFTNPPVISGSFSDDDGPAEVFYSIDGGTEERLLVENCFDIYLNQLARGEHSISVYGVDKDGLRGEEHKRTFFYANEKVPIELTTVKVSEEKTFDYALGATISVLRGTEVQGSIQTPFEIGEITYTLDEQEPTSLRITKGKTNNEKVFSIPLSLDLPHNRIPLKISGTTALGGLIDYSTFFYRITEKEPQYIHDEEGLYIIDPRVQWSNVYLEQTEPLIGYFNGRPIASVDLTSVSENEDVEIIEVTTGGRIVTISAEQEGITNPTEIVVTTVDGDVFEAGPYQFYIDSVPPSLSIESPAAGVWVNEREIQCVGEVVERNGLEYLEYSIDGGESYSPITYIVDEQQPVRYIIDDILRLPAEDGICSILFKATDKTGNRFFKTIPVQKDTVYPEIRVLQPPSDKVINGVTTITGQTVDEGIITSVEFSDDGEGYSLVTGKDTFVFDIDFSMYIDNMPDTFYIRAEDKAGNVTLTNLTFSVDFVDDKPVVLIQTPPDGEVVRNDFVISGMVFDDDGIENISYRLDKSPEFIELEGDNSFTVSIPLADVADNEHVIEVKATDIYGIESDVFLSTFKVSKEEPAAILFRPLIENTVKGIITLRGASFDKNGIQGVFVSFDNGNSFQQASLQDEEELLLKDESGLLQQFDTSAMRKEWKYRLDTSIVKDGTHAIIVKSIDTYGTEGLYTTLINIDNTPPDITLSLPNEGTEVTKELLIDGRVSDNVVLSSLKLRLFSLQDNELKKNPIIEKDLSTQNVFREVISTETLTSGWYDVTLEAKDFADNTAYASKNIRVQEVQESDRIDLFFPQDGKQISGFFSIEGRVVSKKDVEKVTLLLDSSTFDVIEVGERGFFKYLINPENVNDGRHTIRIKAESGSQTEILSEEHSVFYKTEGAWVTVKSHTTGDFVSGRPFIEGEAGYYLSPVEQESESFSQYKELKKKHNIEKVEVSIDNGRTFSQAQGKEKWRFRLETQEFPDGDLPILVKAHVKDIGTSIVKLLLIVDERPPEITLLKPSEQGRFNDIINIAGYSEDNYAVDSIEANLRQGDKASYQVPQFIQGLYIDAHALGSTYAEVGAGLTFFDDNVKLQVMGGFAPPGRFYGFSLGFKLLANVATIPFEFIFGPDLSFFSMSFAIGSSFMFFTMTEDTIVFTEEGVILGSVLGQWEFAKFTFEKLPVFKSYALYSEISLWFISSDIQAQVVPRLAFGLRIGVF